MFFTGCLGERVQHHHGRGRLVEEVQRLEEDGYQVLLRGGWNAFGLNTNVRLFVCNTQDIAIDSIPQTEGPALQKFFRPTHGTERRRRRRGRRVVGGFISTHIIPSPIKIASWHFKTSLLLCSLCWYSIPLLSYTIYCTHNLVFFLQVHLVRRQWTQNNKTQGKGVK